MRVKRVWEFTLTEMISAFVGSFIGAAWSVHVLAHTGFFNSLVVAGAVVFGTLLIVNQAVFSALARFAEEADR